MDEVGSSIEKIVRDGHPILICSLRFVNFKLLKEGNGTGYSLYRMGDEYFLFKRGEHSSLNPCMIFEDPKILDYINHLL